MAQEVRQFSLTVPPGTPQVPGLSLDMSFPPREVDAVQITIPPGPNGTVGFALQNSGVQIIPYASDQWIVTNDEKITLDLAGYINSGSWQLIAYNSGARPHTIYVRFLLNIIDPTARTPVPTLISPTLISNG